MLRNRNIAEHYLQRYSECHDVAASNLSDFWNNIAKNASKGNNTAMERRKFAPVGKVLPGVRISVRSDNLEEQPPGVPGEVIVTLAYYRRDEYNSPLIPLKRCL